MKKNVNLDIHCLYSDVFMTKYLEGAEYTRVYNFPIVDTVEEVPSALIPFDKMKKYENRADEFFIHFFLQDASFERVWKAPETYIPLMKKYKGCIMPDFSLYRDMPYPQQIYNCYRNRLLGYIFAKNGIKVLMNLSFSDSRSLDFAIEGIPKEHVLVVGNLGTIKGTENRDVFHNSLYFCLKKLKPRILIVVGSCTKEITDYCLTNNIELHSFTPEWDGAFIMKEAFHG